MVDSTDVLFHWDGNEFDLSIFRDCLRENNTAALRGLVGKNEALEAIARVRKNFDESLDEIHDPSDFMRMTSYLQKIVSVDPNPDAEYVGNRLGRNLRMMIDPMWGEESLGMREIFSKMIKFRNLLYGREEDFASSNVSDGLWSASRIHHYQTGKGYMEVHADKILADVAEKSEMEGYYQVVLILSQKPDDFSEGGGFAQIGDKEIILEDEFEVGDIVVYDGRIQHGVKMIDPKVTNSDPSAGRYAAFVSLYKDLGGVKDFVDSLH